MRTTEHSEICISNDNQTIGEEHFYLKWKGEEREQTDEETERERACVCVCVCVLVDTDDSVSQHPQTSWDRETHLVTIDRRHPWSISEDFWERSEMMFLTVGLMFGSDILNRRQIKKGVPFWQLHSGLYLGAMPSPIKGSTMVICSLAHKH
jgi:hypothetical protein